MSSFCLPQHVSPCCPGTNRNLQHNKTIQLFQNVTAAALEAQQHDNNCTTAEAAIFERHHPWLDALFVLIAHRCQPNSICYQHAHALISAGPSPQKHEFHLKR